VDTPQYQYRTDNFDFDMVVNVWGQSLSPGNEQRNYWGSRAASEPGSDNLAGIRDPVIVELSDGGLDVVDAALSDLLVHEREQPLAELLGQRLDSKADRRRKRSLPHAARDLARDTPNLAILVRVRMDSVSVLEVDAVVLDRLSLELFAEARVNRVECGMTRYPESAAKRCRVRRVLLERRERLFAATHRDVERKVLRSFDQRMNGLAGIAFAGIPRRKRQVRLPQRRGGLGDRRRIEARTTRAGPNRRAAHPL
jgi:hypothetical protein